MQSDFDPMIYKFDRTIKVYPVGDLHIGAAKCMVDAWNRFKQKLIAEPDSYITVGGDVLNNSIKSSVGNIYEETMRPSEQKRWVAEQLSDIKDRILCVVNGNHCERSSKETDDSPLYDVCCKLDIEERFRENAAFLILRMGDINGAGQRNPTYTMCVTHGSGGGVLTGGAINKNERFGMVIDGMDVLVTAHVHKGAITKPQKIVIDAHNKKISLRDFTCVISTSWLEYGAYALRKQLTPASNQIQSIVLHRDHKQVEVVW